MCHFQQMLFHYVVKDPTSRKCHSCNSCVIDHLRDHPCNSDHFCNDKLRTAKELWPYLFQHIEWMFIIKCKRGLLQRQMLVNLQRTSKTKLVLNSFEYVFVVRKFPAKHKFAPQSITMQSLWLLLSWTYQKQ